MIVCGSNDDDAFPTRNTNCMCADRTLAQTMLQLLVCEANTNKEFIADHTYPDKPDSFIQLCLLLNYDTPASTRGILYALTRGAYLILLMLVSPSLCILLSS